MSNMQTEVQYVSDADGNPVGVLVPIELIDSRRLAAAGLKDALEITVQPGEIKIRCAPSCEFEGPDAAKEVEETYPLIDESFREDWEAPGMDDYDRYEEFRKK